jgi:hypothetical protein
LVLINVPPWFVPVGAVPVPVPVPAGLVVVEPGVAVGVDTGLLGVELVVVGVRTPELVVPDGPGVLTAGPPAQLPSPLADAVDVDAEAARSPKVEAPRAATMTAAARVLKVNIVFFSYSIG